MMERLTERNNCTMHENGVCCTHFLSPECHEVSGNCSAGCKWEEVAWSTLAAYEDSGLTPAEIKSLYAEWDVMMSVLNSIGGGHTRLRELAEADRDGRVIITDTTDTDIAHDGLKLKYRVYKAENNAPVENCFVLLPMKDRAARIAMEAYAKATENKELSEDIFDVLKILACS